MTPSHAPRTSPRGLGFGVEVSCPLCSTSKASFQKYHVRSRVALTQRRFRWCHVQMLSKLAEFLERCRVEQQTVSRFLQLLSSQGNHTEHPQDITILRLGKDWHMVAHLKEFLREIMTATRPDIVLWFAVDGSVLMIKLTISWEEETRGNTSSMPSLQQSGWKSRVYPVEIGSGGFVLVQLLRIAGMTGTSLEREVRGLGQKAEN